MDKIQVVTGVTNVYHSHETKGFQEADRYPIAWEFMFRNDEAGRAFALRLQASFARLPRAKGYILNLDGKDSDAARCVECVFQDQHSFRKILNELLADMVIYDEQQSQVIPKQEMADKARSLKRKTVLAI